MSSRVVSGTPSAVPAEPAKLVVMSFRTTPLAVRTSGPFVPSPGKGPAVSSGMAGAQASPAAADAADDEPAVDEAAAADDDGKAEAPGAQAATANTPARPRSWRTRRRSMSGATSAWRPRAERAARGSTSSGPGGEAGVIAGLGVVGGGPERRVGA